MENTKANRKKVLQIANQLQDELTEHIRKLKIIGIKDTSIITAFKHFLKINDDKRPKTIEDYKRFYKYFIVTFDENRPCSTINKSSIEEWMTTIQ